MMTDPIADMLTRIRNGNVAMRPEVLMPASKQKSALAEVLKREGFIADYAVVQDPNGSGKYGTDRQRTISGIKRISTPGLRVYRAATEVPRVLGGLGVAVLSTSHGLMTDREARKRNVGGEVMCFVW
jgi:small subunit ribosomal protein S8